MKHRPDVVSCWLALALVATGCAGELVQPERFEAISSSSIPCALDIDVPTELFVRNCGTVACHEGSLPAAGLDLISTGLGERLVGIASPPGELCEGRLLIDPADPARSLMLQKVHARPPCGEIMPQTRLDTVLLTRDERACVRAWIYDVAAELGRPTGADAANGADAGFDGDDL